MFSGSASKLYHAAGNEWVTSPQYSFRLASVVDRLYILSSHNIIFVTDDLSLIIYQLQALDKIPIKNHQLSYFRHKNVPIISVCGRVLVTKHTKVRQAHWIWGGFSSGGITFALYIKYLTIFAFHLSRL